jgi:transcriptional regulator with XRE-family HTH domain
VAEVAWQLGVKPQEYREIEAGKRSPDFETWDRICKFYGQPQTFLDEPGLACPSFIPDLGPVAEPTRRDA